MTFIKAISYYLPEDTISTETLSKQLPNTDVSKTEKMVGVYEHRIAPKEVTAADLAVKAAEKLFNEYSIQPEEIDFVIFCTQSPDYFLPSSACIIQDKLNIPTTAGAFDFDLGCSGYVYGLAIAKGLVNTGIAKNILLLTRDTLSKTFHPKDNNRILFGDAATASIISIEGFAEIGDFSLGTDGSGYDKLIIKSGGARQHAPTGTHSQDEEGKDMYDDFFYMNGNGVFNFTLEVVPTLIKEIEAKNGIEGDKVDLFVFHQANKFMLNTIRKIAKLPKDKVYIDIDKSGNTTSSTIPIALKDALEINHINKNNVVLIAGFGVGLSWGGTILKF